MRSLALTLAVSATLVLSADVARAAAPASVSGPRPRVEVAFVLDTTGSMGGLIEGAKRRIWSIARRIGEGRPRPDLRIALVAYRDRADAYVTQVHDLTADMDAVYERLTSFRAEGGGDTPEHVSAALSAAVHRVSWSREPGLKVIFLVGDAPPHVDYQDGFNYARHAGEARQRGIAVEAIQCGLDPVTTRFWREIASLGDGHYAQIDGQGGMPARVTPADAELARLNRDLAETVVVTGSVPEQAAAYRRLETRAAMPAAVAAEAAGYFASAPRLADKDLVALSDEEQKREVARLQKAQAEAPKALQGKTDAQALAYLKEQQQKRASLQVRIAELQKQRDDYLQKAAAGAPDGFDAQVVGALRERAARFGIRY
jgi:von Willebrand factor type A domain